MNIALILVLNFLSISLSAQEELLGTYSFGNGFNFDSIELLPDGKLRKSSFSDMYGTRTSKGSYQLEGDTLLLSLGKPLIFRRTDRFVALVPIKEAGNWDKYLKEFEERVSQLPKELPQEYLPSSFSEYGIYVKPN